MTVVETRFFRDPADRITYLPVGVPSAGDVQTAIDTLAALVALNNTQPPTITATTVNFAQSPYTVLSTDFLLEVDSSGGVVVINPQAVGVRTKALEIKDVAGNAFTNNIQINTTIEGQTPYKISADYGSVTIKPNKAQTAYEVVTW